MKSLIYTWLGKVVAKGVILASSQNSFSFLLAVQNIFLSAGIECYLSQNHIYSADDTETATPSYTLLNLSAGTDVHWGRKKVAELYLTAHNLLDRAYQNHLSRLKYLDVNEATGRRGVYNMGRNVTVKLVIPILMGKP